MLAYDGDFPDPFLLHSGGSYYAYATNAAGHHVQVLRSADLSRWEHLGDALPRLPRWAAPGRTWSPAVLSTPAGLVLYVVVAVAARDRQAIATATADRPEGPFHPVGDGPLVYQHGRGGSIDPDPFVDRDGAAYLAWKSDDNAVGGRSALWGRRLSADGLGFAARLRRPARLLRHDAAWERPLVEAPAVVQWADGYHLLYSGGWWESASYGLGHAVARTPLGAYRKTTVDGPWLGSGGGLAGPGGAAFLPVGDGGLVMAFHAWAADRVGYGRGGRRALHLARVDLSRDRPALLGPVPGP